MKALIVQDAITPGLKDLAAQFPKEYAAGLKDLGRRWRNTLAKGFRSGIVAGNPLAPLSEITRKLRQGNITRRAQLLTQAKAARSSTRRRLKLEGVQDFRRAKAYDAMNRRVQKANRSLLSATNQFGGRLPTLSGFDAQTLNLQVGYIDAIFSGAAKSVANYQPQRVRRFSKAERRMLHVVYRGAIPTTIYNKPERSVVAPFRVEFLADAERVLRKSIAARVAAAKAKAK